MEKMNKVKILSLFEREIQKKRAKNDGM